MKLAVILPSRGLIFAECEDALARNLAHYKYKVYRSWNLTIPECQNVLVEQALQEEPTHLLFIEEDVVLPDGSFDQLLALDSDIACLDYGVAGWGCVTRNPKGEILWCGLGATLVKSEVFKALEKPYFRSDKALLLNYWPEVVWIDSGKQAYGGQDIYFCMKAREKGFKIEQIEGEAKHLKLEALGTREINNGLHVIALKPKIEKKQVI